MRRLAPVLLCILAASAGPTAADGDLTGRWTFPFDAGAYEQGTPQGTYDRTVHGPPLSK